MNLKKVLNVNTIKNFKNLWMHLNKRRRFQYKILLLIMIISSLAEMISIGAIVPFLAILTTPEKVYENEATKTIVNYFYINSPNELILPLTLIFCAAILISGAIKLLLLWATTSISHATGSDLSYAIYERTLFQPYSVHIARNSSDVIVGISTKVNLVINNLMQMLTLISSSALLISIFSILLLIDALVSISAMVGLLSVYITITWITRNKAKINSIKVAENSIKVIKLLQEGLGGIRDILIDGTQSAYCKIYKSVDLPLRKAQGSNSFISSSPRSIVEALSLILIALIAYILASSEEGFVKYIPVLGSLALGAQRMLPAVQQIYSSWTSIRGDQKSMEDTIKLLNQKMPNVNINEKRNKIEFKNKIEINKVSFSYDNSNKKNINNINLIIKKGSKVGVIGTTGSGKSTLLDILMGLLEPSEGSIKIDNVKLSAGNKREWQAHIAHVPQSIFLSDSTIAENIAFGVDIENIDYERVKLAASQAQITVDIESWKDKYNTMVGEKGVRLSGGQRQRIGIARALYKTVDVLIFDEATSALDNKTEQAVMQAIEELSDEITIVIIAHRLSTLDNCDLKIELDDGKIIKNYAK